MSKQHAASGGLILMALLVVGLAMLAGISMAQVDEFLLSKTKLDDQTKSVVRELALGDCRPPTDSGDDVFAFNLIFCIDTLRSATAGNSTSDLDAPISNCCSDLNDGICACSVEKNQGRLGIDIPKVCGKPVTDTLRDRCAAAEDRKRKIEDRKRREEALKKGDLGACGQLLMRMAIDGKEAGLTADDVTPCVKLIASCSAGCQKQ